MTQFKLTLVATAIALTFSSSAIFAAEKELNTLDPIIVTASRTAENMYDVPARVAVIDEQQIEQSAIQGLSQVLQKDAAANVVQSGGLGQITSIFLRGTDSDHTLVLRDGVRLNGASTSTATLNFLDTSDLQRIEILKGPSSVLYGSDAIGGVVQLITKKPEKTGAFVTGIYGENDTYKAVVGADIAENGFYAQVRGQRLESDGTPVAGEGVFNNDASYQQKGGSAKIGYENNQFGISAEYAQNKGTSEYLNFDWNAFSYYEPSQDFKNELINVKGHVNLGNQVTLNTRLSQFKDKITQRQQNAAGQYDFVYNTNQEAELYAQVKLTEQQNLLAGSTYRTSKGDVYSAGSWSTVRYTNTVDNLGYFIQHQYHSDKINTQVGVRVEDNERFGTHTVGQGAIRYHFTPATSLYANIGSAFRAPSTNELYAVGWGANPNLKPEESISYELGFDHKISDAIQAGISAYRTNVDELIAWSGTQNVNISKATFTGGETYLKWKADDVFVNASYAYVQPKNDITKQDLNRRPRQSAALTVGLENEKYGVSSSVVAKSRSKDFSNSTVSGYAVVNFNAYWNATPYLKFFTNIDNVGDVKYATAYEGSLPLSYYRNGGRQANIGFTLKY